MAQLWQEEGSEDSTAIVSSSSVASMLHPTKISSYYCFNNLRLTPEMQKGEKS